MIIKSLELKNFRNYQALGIAFDAGTNILYGDNTQGKTNVLESLYVSGTTKSHKGSKDKEMIRFDADEAHIRTIVEKNGVENRIDIHLKKNSAKGIAVNGIPIRKAGETTEVGISRVHLHRKLKELTNQTTRDFIRNIRLKEAARLLSEKQHTISEIAMLTGFTDPNNFSTTFKELYGMPPSMYMKEQLSKKEE